MNMGYTFVCKIYSNNPCLVASIDTVCYSFKIISMER